MNLLSSTPSRPDGGTLQDGGYSATEQNLRSSENELPHPSEIRQIIRQRKLRSWFFDEDLFADPAWDMLLDLAAAHGEGARVSVTSLCIASGVPSSTELRWIKRPVDEGILERAADAKDKRRAFISLSEAGRYAMARYFAEMNRQG